MRTQEAADPDRAVSGGNPPYELVEPGAPLPRLHRAVLMLMFLLLAILAMRQVGSPDVGFHLKAGDSILSGHGWPRTDSFTYTLNNHPYTDTTWGYQVLLALAFKAAGAPGMAVLNLLILLGIFYVLYKTARLASVDPGTLVLLFGAGIVACEWRFEIRPEWLSCLFLAFLLHWLHRRALGLSVRLWLLPLLFWVWANGHALFILGWIALACAVAGFWIRDRKPDRPLLLWAGAAFLAPLANPYGLKGMMFPFTLITRFQADNPFAETIGEFASPFTSGAFSLFLSSSNWPSWMFRLLLVLLLPCLVILIRRRNYWAALVCAAFLPLELRMVRNTPLLIVTALPLLIWTLPVSRVWRWMGMRRRGARIGGIAVAVAAGLMAVVLGMRVLTGAYYTAMRRSACFGWAWSRSDLPVDAADWVKRTKLPGTMLNHLNFGGYLMWALPQPVFIDGRLEVVGEDFFRAYMKIFSSEDALEALAAKYNVRWIIFPYSMEPVFLARLSADPQWRPAHVDAVAAVFVRDGPDAERRVDRTSLERLAPPSPPLNALPGLGGPARRTPLVRWLRGMVLPSAYPGEAKNLGIYHYYRGELAQAEAWFRAALDRGGADYFDLYLDLGTILLREKKYDEAARCYDVILGEDPENGPALAGLSGLAREKSQNP